LLGWVDLSAGSLFGTGLVTFGRRRDHLLLSSNVLWTLYSIKGAVGSTGEASYTAPMFARCPPWAG